jgi:hypothetical protein
VLPSGLSVFEDNNIPSIGTSAPTQIVAARPSEVYVRLAAYAEPVRELPAWQKVNTGNSNPTHRITTRPLDT